jgi:hypothetical protein
MDLPNPDDIGLGKGRIANRATQLGEGLLRFRGDRRRTVEIVTAAGRSGES